MDKPKFTTEKENTISATYPRWLLQSLNNIADSREWNGFVGDLQDSIEHQLLESHIQHFADLSDAEKLMFVDQGVLSLQQSPAYQVAIKEIVATTDQHINDNVSQEMRVGRNPFLTRTELLLSSVQEGIVSIIDRWPELRVKLVRYLNQPLPAVMRHHVWRVFLKDEKVNDQYLDMLNNNPRLAVSSQDKEITQRVEQFLNNEPSLSDMKGSVGCFYGAKAVLSYHQAMKKSSARLTDTEILLVMPLVQVISDRISRKEPASMPVMQVFVQEYFTLLKSRPAYMKDQPSSSEDNSGGVSDELRQFSQRVMSNVSKINPRIAQAYMDAFSPSPVDIVATEAKLFESLGDAMVNLIRPIIRPLFVGLVGREALLFIWDQYIIGLDSPGFNDIYLPAVTACFLVLIAKPLTASTKNMAMFETLIREEGRKLKPADFQYLLNHYFYSELFRQITQEKMAPSMDPTLKPFDTQIANHSGGGDKWEAWYSDFAQPQRTKPADRDRFRLLREEEKLKMRQMEIKFGEYQSRCNALEQALQVTEQSKDSELANEKLRAMREQRALEDQLTNEKQLRDVTEKAAQDEIKQLKEKLEFAYAGVRFDDNVPSHIGVPKGLTRPPSPKSRAESIGSLYVFPPPANSPDYKPKAAVQQTAADSKSNEPTTSKERVKIYLEDYFTKVMAGVNKIAEGEPYQALKLNKCTRQCLTDGEQDVIKAQMNVFGRRLEEGELEKMDEGNDSYYTEKQNEELIRLQNERRQQKIDKNTRAAII